MDKQSFIQAKKSFPLQQELAEFSAVEEERRKFVDYFTLEKIANMTLDEYVYGKGITKNNFCYGIERTLKMLGNIQGSRSPKFGVYYNKENQTYEHTKKFGRNYLEAFDNVKNAILDLLDAGIIQDLRDIARNPLAPIIKGKILSVYYPEIYLNIFSEEHVDHYLKAFDLWDENLSKADVAYKRMVLVDFKYNDPDMHSWPMNMFAVFLWKYWPKPPQTDKFYTNLHNKKDQLESDKTLIRKGNFGYGGEGDLHKGLKEYIYNNPWIIGIHSFKQREMEHILLSGDRLDVWFELADGSEIAVEVKSEISSSADVLRGLFQCVKYQAIMDAENLIDGITHNNHVILVLGGSLSETNAGIRGKFGIEVYENIKP